MHGSVEGGGDVRDIALCKGSTVWVQTEGELVLSLVLLGIGSCGRSQEGKPAAISDRGSA
jgi:hypothetical protein